VQLVSTIFNLCGHDPPTSQTDGQTTCDSKTALCTVLHRAVKTRVPELSCGVVRMIVHLSVLSPPACDGRTDEQTDTRRRHLPR